MVKCDFMVEFQKARMNARTLVKAEAFVESSGSIDGMPFVATQFDFSLDKIRDTRLEKRKRGL